jgi:hypothetical protein
LRKQFTWMSKPHGQRPSQSSIGDFLTPALASGRFSSRCLSEAFRKGVLVERCVSVFLCLVVLCAAPAALADHPAANSDAGQIISGYQGKRVGIGTSQPAATLDVYQGEIKIGSTGAACTAETAGALRSDKTHLQFCDGASCEMSASISRNEILPGAARVPVFGVFGRHVHGRYCPRAISTTNCWSSSICPFVCCRLRLERLLPHFGPQRSRLFALIAFELVRHPEQQGPPACRCRSPRGAPVGRTLRETGC